jgi:curli biogenesis system outer membrane secretion channel CsgG
MIREIFHPIGAYRLGWGTFCSLVMLVMTVAFDAKAQSNSVPLRLAVIAADTAAATAADWLTVELTKTDRLQLLERAEIDRVRREQGLSAANKDNLELGQILGADGLLLLDTAKEGTNQFLTARLVAVKPGVVIGSFRSPWPVADPRQWAKWIPARFGPLFPKLGVLAKDALPISVVNLRSAVQSAESQDGEQQLTALAIERLTQERELFVLERRRMDLLSDEKEFKGVEESAFWDGSYLLDGIIDRDGYSPDTITLNALLTPPKGGAPVSIEIKGSRTNLAGLVNQLADRVSHELKLGPGVAWNPADEAEQYFEEAGWAYKWHMIEEARAACESSWSLGKRTKEVAELRIRICGFPILNTSQLASPDSATDAIIIGATTTSLRLYEAAFQAFLATDEKPDMTWYDLGLNLLNSASSVLNLYYFAGKETRLPHKEEFAEIRALTRETANMIGGNRAYQRLDASQGHDFLNVHNETASWIWAGHFGLAVFQAVQGPLWLETPEECLQKYRDLARSGDLDRVLLYIPHLRIIAWNTEDRKPSALMWEEFVQELCHSSNAMTEVDGYWLDLADATTDQQIKDRGRGFFRAAVQNAYALVGANRQQDVFGDAAQVLADRTGGNYFSPSWEELEHYNQHSFRQDFGAAAFVGYLETDALFNSQDFAKFARTMRESGGDGVLASPERVRNVLAAMESYKARITQEQQQHQLAYDCHNYDAIQSWLRRAMPPEMGEAASLTNPIAPSSVPRPLLPPRLAAASNAPAALRTTSSSGVHVTRFWGVPAEVKIDYSSVQPGVEFSGGKYRQGRYWFEAVSGHNGSFLRQAFIFAVNLRDLQTDAIALPVSGPLPDPFDGQPGFHGTCDSFEAASDFVYINGGDKLRRYSLRAKTWETLPVLLQGRTRLTLLGGRLFILGTDILLELKEDASGADILASSRRRPALNPLDSNSAYTRLSLGADGSLRLWLEGKIYERKQAANDWLEKQTIPGTYDRRAAIALDEGLAIWKRDPVKGNQLWLLPDDQTTLEFALNLAAPIPEGRRRPMPLNRPSPPGPSESENPRWQFPADAPTAASAMIRGTSNSHFVRDASGNPSSDDMIKGTVALDDGDLWFFAGYLTVKGDSARGAVLSEGDGRHALLLHFQKDRSEAQQIPLWFDVSDGVLTQDWWRAFRHFKPTEAIALFTSIFQFTPQGLVIACEHIPGFWLIPRSDLEDKSASPDSNTQLLAAAEGGNAAVATELLARGALVEARNFKGWTPLIFAAENGDLDMVRLLIEHGADVNAKATADPGATVLCFAVGGGNLDVVKELGKHRASVNAPGQDGLTRMAVSLGPMSSC